MESPRRECTFTGARQQWREDAHSFAVSLQSLFLLTRMLYCSCKDAGLKCFFSENYHLLVPGSHDTTGVMSHNLITLSVPEVSSHPLVASKCTWTMLCLLSWKVAVGARSSSVMASWQLSQTRTSNSKPMSGMEERLELHLPHTAFPHFRQWCCLSPIFLLSHICLKFQKKGWSHFWQESLSNHSGVSCLSTSMFQTTMPPSPPHEMSCRVCCA